MRKFLILLLAALLLAISGWTVAGAKHSQAHRLRQRVAKLERQVETISGQIRFLQTTSSVRAENVITDRSCAGQTPTWTADGYIARLGC